MVSISPSLAWKLVLAAVLLGAVLVSQLASAPPRPAAPGEVRRLMLCALGLYAVGVLAAETRHSILAGVVLSTGIAICALATWLARGDSEDPPSAEDPDDQPPPQPDGVPEFDWARFESDLANYATSRRGRSPAGAPR